MQGCLPQCEKMNGDRCYLPVLCFMVSTLKTLAVLTVLNLPNQRGTVSQALLCSQTEEEETGPLSHRTGSGARGP